MASIYLIRHGQASFGSDNYDQLSTLGQRQADLTGQYLRDVGLTFDYAVAGDLSRQQETGTRVLASQQSPVALTTDPRFNEIDNEEQIHALLPGLCEQDPKLAEIVDGGLTDSKRYQKVIAAVFNAWVAPDCPDVGITPWSDFRDGVEAALKSVMRATVSGGNAAVFTSGGTIATAVGLVLGVSSDKVYGFYEPVFNCSVTRFIFSGNRVSLSNFNDAAHLQLLSAQLGERLVTYR
ncbi:MAG: histidine phosphatase family protein [Halieaceae bacterium]|jgi:broad specificity phosphatase PhoE|nr:histidine phosphatase family protein [Halieaceae bacterium]